MFCAINPETRQSKSSNPSNNGGNSNSNSKSDAEFRSKDFYFPSTKPMVPKYDPKVHDVENPKMEEDKQNGQKKDDTNAQPAALSAEASQKVDDLMYVQYMV